MLVEPLLTELRSEVERVKSLELTGRLRWLEGRLARQQQNLTQARAHLEQAYSHFAVTERPFWLGRTQFALAQVYAQLGELQRAVQAAQQARQHFRTLAAPAFVQTVEQWLQAHPHKVKRPPPCAAVAPPPTVPTADALSQFLGAAAVKLGVPTIKAEHWHFRESLLKQFFATAYLPEPMRKADITLINLRNGRLEISATGWHLRTFDRHDFLTYQLPFDFDEANDAPQWQRFLDRVQPDNACQQVLAEYLGYCFTRGLKLEKVLLLYGSGANGKSVFCDVISALLGAENISHYSLSSLSEPQGYFRARLANKLLNYGSELDARLQTDAFKQLASGERIQARLPYGQPFELRDYAKLAFNCNELPRDVEHSEAYFRRFLVIPFTVMIPEAERNVELANEIIRAELSGVFNWVLAGLKRLLVQKNFSPSDAAKIALAEYRRESDSVMMFLDEEGYVPSLEDWVLLKTLYAEYRSYCLEAGFKPLGRGKFGLRLRANGMAIEKERSGSAVFVSRT